MALRLRRPAPNVPVRMAYWLLKTGPDATRWEDLVHRGVATWSGDAEGQDHLGAMREGDRAVIYDSRGRRAVGIAEVVRSAHPDPRRPDALCVDVRAVEPLPAPVPLEAMKTEAAFEGSLLLRQGWLSIVPLSPSEWRDLAQLADVIARTGGLGAEERF